MPDAATIEGQQLAPWDHYAADPAFQKLPTPDKLATFDNWMSIATRQAPLLDGYDPSVWESRITDFADKTRSGIESGKTIRESVGEIVPEAAKIIALGVPAIAAGGIDTVRGAVTAAVTGDSEDLSPFTIIGGETLNKWLNKTPKTFESSEGLTTESENVVKVRPEWTALATTVGQFKTELTNGTIAKMSPEERRDYIESVNDKMANEAAHFQEDWKPNKDQNNIQRSSYRADVTLGPRSILGNPDNAKLLAAFTNTRNPKYFDELIKNVTQSTGNRTSDERIEKAAEPFQGDGAMNWLAREAIGLGSDPTMIALSTMPFMGLAGKSAGGIKTAKDAAGKLGAAAKTAVGATVEGEAFGLMSRVQEEVNNAVASGQTLDQAQGHGRKLGWAMALFGAAKGVISAKRPASEPQPQTQAGAPPEPPQTAPVAPTEPVAPEGARPAEPPTAVQPVTNEPVQPPTPAQAQSAPIEPTPPGQAAAAQAAQAVVRSDPAAAAVIRQAAAAERQMPQPKPAAPAVAPKPPAEATPPVATPEPGLSELPAGQAPDFIEKPTIEPVPQDVPRGTPEATTETVPGTKDVAQRMVNAENRFIDFAMETGGITREQAATALDTYRKAKAIKIDPVGGQFTFTRGEFAERDVLRRAAEIEEPAAAPAGAKDEGKPEIPQSHAVANAPIVDLPVAKLILSSEVPQFKREANEKGVVEPLQGAYDKGTGPIQIWERLDGTQEVISGRHRFDLAQRNGEATIPAQVHYESRGFTARDAARRDAELNILDGQGSTPDYANYFRNSDTTEAEAVATGLLGRAKGKAGWRIGQDAGEDAYALHQSGRITDAQAEAIARIAPKNDGLQAVGVRQALDGASAEKVSDMMLLAKKRAADREPTEVQPDIFGFDDSAIKEMEAIAKVAAAERKNLKEQVAAVKGASKKPEVARKLGVDVSDPEGLAKRVAELEDRLDFVRANPDKAVAQDAPKEPAPAVKPQDQLFDEGDMPFNLEKEPTAPELVPPSSDTARFGEQTLTQHDLFAIEKIVTEVDPFKSANAAEKMYGGAAEAAKTLERHLRTMDANKGAKKDFGKEQRQRFKEVIRVLNQRGKEAGETEATFEKATLPRKITSDVEPTTPSGEPIALADIRKYIATALDVPVRVGLKVKGGQRGALGLFRVKPETIRLKALNDIPTLAHEGGHYLHYLLFPAGTTRAGKPVASDFAKTFDAELLPLGAKTSKPSYSQAQVRREGVAEFVREWLTDRTQALAKAPAFTAHLESELQAKFPEIWKVLQKAQADIALYINQPALAKVRSMVSRGPQDESLPMGDRLRKLYDEWVNDLGPLERAGKRLEEFGLPKDQAEQAAKLAANYIGGWRGKVEHTLFRKQIDFNGNEVGPSLHEVLSGTGSLENFGDYMIAKRAIELHGRGIKSGIELPDAKEVVRLLEPEYGGRASIYRKWMDNNLQLLVDSGVISKESATKMRDMNQDYVSFARVYESLGGSSAGSGRGFVDLPQGVRRIKGSDRQIVDPLESGIKNLYLFRDLAERNRIGNAFIDAVTATQGGGRVGEELARKVKPVQISDEEVRAALKKSGIDPDELPDTDLAFRVYRAARQQSATDGIFTVWKNGKESVYQIDDPQLYRSLKLMDSTDAAVVSRFPLMKPFRLLTRLLRAGATLTPDFIARNPFRDQVTAGVFSKHGFVPFWDGFRGLLSAIKRDDLYWQWVKSGGRYADFIASDRTDLQSVLKDVVREPSALNTALQLANPLNVIKTLQKLSEFMEQGTRLGEFRRSKEAGLSDMMAANESKEITLNFSRGGFKGKLVNQLVAFFNAQVQDLDKVVRAHKERPFATAMKAMTYITTPSLISWFLGKDDEDIQNLPEWRKTFFWNFKLEGHVWSFPKPFLLGQLYGSSVERGLDYATGRDPNAVRKWMHGTLEATSLKWDALLPTGSRPVLETITNYSFFKDRQIESASLQNLPVTERANPNTTETAKQLSRGLDATGLGISPVKIDNLIQGMAGGLGRYSAELADYGMAKLGLVNVPDAPAKTWRDLPGIRAFSTSDFQQSPYVDRFYNSLTSAEATVQAFKQKVKLGDLAGMEQYMRSNQEQLAWYGGNTKRGPLTEMRKIAKNLSEIRAAMKAVEASRTMTPIEKRAALIQLNDNLNRTAEMGFDAYASQQDKKAKF